MHKSGQVNADEVAKPYEVPALVLGSGITALATMRCLHRAGIPFYCVAPSPGMETYSRYYSPLPVYYPEFVSVQQLPTFLSAIPVQKAVVLACSDHLAQAVAGLAGELKARFPCSQSSLSVLQLFTDKGAFSRVLVENQVPAPKTIVLTNESQIREVGNAAIAGFFLKPRDSQGFFQTYGVKAFQCQTVDEAIARYREISGTGFEVLLQDYIPGPPSSHYYVEGFVDSKGVVRTTFARQRLRMFPRNFGNSSLTRSIPLDEVAEAAEHLHRLFRVVGYRGIYSAEFKKDPRDNVLKVLEVNSRPWWYIGFAANCGINVAEMAYRDSLGLSVTNVNKYTIGRQLVYPYYDYFALKERYPRNFVRRAFEMAKWSCCDFAVFQLGDAVPAWYELLRILPGRKKGRAISIARP